VQFRAVRACTDPYDARNIFTKLTQFSRWTSRPQLLHVVLRPFFVKLREEKCEDGVREGKKVLERVGNLNQRNFPVKGFFGRQAHGLNEVRKDKVWRFEDGFGK